jgi:drug/metabolite transporter (DMT)-like permease
MAHLIPSPARDRPVRGITLKLLSVVAFVGMASFIKAAGEVPAGEIVFFRSFFAIPPVLAMMIWRKELGVALSTNRPLGHLLRGTVGVTSMTIGFFALTRLPLPEAITLGYAQPLIVVVLSALVLRETVRIYRWTAVIVGLIGVIIISLPRFTLFSGASEMSSQETLGVIAALTAAAIGACALLLTRNLVTTERTPTIVLWFCLTCSSWGLMTIPFGWVMPTPSQATFLILAGIFGGLGQILVTESYRHAEASTVAPFEYSSMILGVLVGYFAFGDVPTIHMLVGGSIVVGAGIFIIWREHRLGVAQAAARKITPTQS